MMLCDKTIRELGLVDPCEEAVPTGNGRIGYGLTSAGYDARLDRIVLVPKPQRHAILVFDQQTIKDRYVETTFPGDMIVIKPGQMILAQTMETYSIPRNCKGNVTGKSTLARLGLHVNTTPLEPGWTGRITLELYNQNSDCSIVLKAGDGICQVEFVRLDDEPEIAYDQKDGRYQGQTMPTPPIIERD